MNNNSHAAPSRSIPSRATDIWPDWINIIKRLQSIGRKSESYSVINMVVLVSPDGKPMLWYPNIKTLEPKRGISIEQLQEKISPEEMNVFLNTIVKGF